MYQWSEKNHLVKGLDAAANAFAGTVSSAKVKLSEFGHATFVVGKGVGATGTATITVQACDDAAGTNPVAVPFRYRVNTTGDTWGGLTDALAAGFATTPGSSQRYEVEVDSEALASLGKAWCFLQSVEVVASAVLGWVDIILSRPRYGTPFNTQIV